MKENILLTIFVFLFFLTSPYAQTEGSVYVIPVKGVIDLGLSGFIERALAEAKENSAKTIILEIDTFGGRVDAAVDICKYLEDMRPIETVAFIDDQAWSAGALISLACRSIIMSPGSSIGSAEPRAGGMMQQQLTDEKTISAIRAKFKSVAEQNGHSVKLAEAMVDKDIQLKKVNIKGEMEILTIEELEEKRAHYKEKDIVVEKTIIQKDKLLNLTAQEAKELRLASAILSSREELLEFLNLKELEVVEISPVWSENLVRFLTHPIVSSLLLTLGFLGILFELRMPGWGISGTLGLIFLALFFWGHYLIGLANWMEVVLFLAGLILISLEVFVIPGFGIAGILGIILFLSGIYLALIKHPFQVPKIYLVTAFYTMAYAFILTFLVALLSIRFVPHLGIWKRVILNNRELKEEGFQATERFEGYIGRMGKALTSLRPAGKALFGEEILDVVAEGEFIEKEKGVRVVKVEGNRIVVEELKENA